MALPYGYGSMSSRGTRMGVAAALAVLPLCALGDEVTFRVTGTLTENACPADAQCVAPFYVGSPFTLDFRFDAQATPTFTRDPYSGGGKLVRWDGALTSLRLTVGEQVLEGPPPEAPEPSHLQVIDDCASCDWFIDLYEMNGYLTPADRFGPVPAGQTVRGQSETVFLNCGALAGDYLTAGDTPPASPPALDAAGCGFAISGARTRELAAPAGAAAQEEDVYVFRGIIDSFTRIEAQQPAAPPEGRGDDDDGHGARDRDDEDDEREDARGGRPAWVPPMGPGWPPGLFRRPWDEDRNEKNDKGDEKRGHGRGKDHDRSRGRDDDSHERRGRGRGPGG